jgi:glutaredoxin
MKKILGIISLLIVLLIPSNIKAITTDYEDVAYKITGQSIEENKINIYLFHGEECPHCQEEIQWLKTIEEDYSDEVNIYYFEVWHDKDNAKMMENLKTSMNVSSEYVPFTVIGNKTFFGFSDTIKEKIQNQIDYYLEKEEANDTVNLPILKNVDAKKVSLPLVALVLGLVDGFNPCAMWILLFLINMLLGMKSKKRMWAIGLTFLLTSGFIYFLSMLGISYVLSITAVTWLKKIIALVALVLGILNIRNYIKTKNSGCHVVNNKKRKKIFNAINKFTHEKSFILALLGVALLGISVNLIELACSLGFPVIFTEILALNEVTGFYRVLYLLLYIFFYMFDDMIVFIIAMFTLEATGLSTKYNRLSHLIGGILMIIMGILLFFKPEWLMFNF